MAPHLEQGVGEERFYFSVSMCSGYKYITTYTKLSSFIRPTFWDTSDHTLSVLLWYCGKVDISTSTGGIRSAGGRTASSETPIHLFFICVLFSRRWVTIPPRGFEKALRRQARRVAATIDYAAPLLQSQNERIHVFSNIFGVFRSQEGRGRSSSYERDVFRSAKSTSTCTFSRRYPTIIVAGWELRSASPSRNLVLRSIQHGHLFLCLA